MSFNFAKPGPSAVYFQVGNTVVSGQAVLPATGSRDLFVSTGPVLLTGLIGIVKKAADATACTIRPYIGAAGAADIAGASASIANAVVGVLFYITGVLATAMQIVTTTPISVPMFFKSGLMVNGIIWPSGLKLGIATSATNLCEVEWYLYFRAIGPLGTNVLAL